MRRLIEEFGGVSGAVGSLRLVVEGRAGPVQAQIPGGPPFAVIGRDPQADLVLDHPEVSRRHAYVQVVGGRPFIIDLESRTGIRLDGSPARSAWIGRGRQLEIGPHRIAIDLDGAPEDLIEAPSPLDVRRPGRDDLPTVVLEARGPSAGASRWRMKAPMVLIGNAGGCRVRLEDPSVSRFHAALLRTSAGPWAVDLLGRGGIAVNGTPVRAARLEDRDELRIGRFRLRLHCGPGTGPGLPAPIAPSDLSAVDRARSLEPSLPVVADDPRLEPLVRQFGQMQQQMVDQFQQALLMMFQVFRTLHQDQAELVRNELDAVRKLTRELQDLQIRAAVAPASPPRPAGPAVAGPPRDRPAPRGGGAQANADVHALLSRRIAAIQEERQGRWQKILNLVTGDSSAP